MPWLYMVKMVHPNPAEFIVSDSWDVDEDGFIKFKNSADPNMGWKYVSVANSLTIECVGLCDEEGKLLDEV